MQAFQDEAIRVGSQLRRMLPQTTAAIKGAVEPIQVNRVSVSFCFCSLLNPAMHQAYLAREIVVG